MEMINESHRTQKKACLHTTWGTEFYCVCVLQMYFLHLMHVYCVFLSFLGPHTSQPFFVTLPARMMKILSSGISLTSHSHTYIVTAGQGRRVRHTHMQQHHSHFRYWSCWFCGPGGWGTTILLTMVAKAGNLGICCFLWIWGLTNALPSSSRKSRLLWSFPLFQSGSTPSRWQTCCMPRCSRCWRILWAASFADVPSHQLV